MKKINEFTEKNVLSASLEFFPLPTQKKKKLIKDNSLQM